MLIGKDPLSNTGKGTMLSLQFQRETTNLGKCQRSRKLMGILFVGI